MGASLLALAKSIYYSVFVYLIMTSESTKLRGKKGKNVSHGTFQRNIVRPRTMGNPAQNNKNFYE